MHPKMLLLSSRPFPSHRTSKSSSSPLSSANINAIEQFARIILLWSCLTTILWWLVFDQFQASVIMVDPLKIFWVLTNSTYLGKVRADALCLNLFSIFNFLPFEFIFQFLYVFEFPSSVNTIAIRSILFTWPILVDVVGAMQKAWKKLFNEKEPMPWIRKMRTSICLFLFIIISREYVVVVRCHRCCWFCRRGLTVWAFNCAQTTRVLPVVRVGDRVPKTIKLISSQAHVVRVNCCLPVGHWSL